MEHRPDPDTLLAAVQKEEAKAQRGKLKIFFGMAAGVGKTYAMLQAAHERLAEGVDVVSGYVETHGRAETETLLADLPLIPRKTYDYRGAALTEMDLDAILARRPALALVDEFAHTNVPGARHPKRYQDILELLDAGIDVYTTVNVQHLESRADTVRQITGITVHETLPDSLLEAADSIELIDLTPEELRKRLAEGKVYLAERADLAAHNFFRIGNLTALREMALRATAERVDHQLQDYMQLKQIAGPWKSGERLMVAVSVSPLSERLVRWTRRMAYNLEAPWLAVYVETAGAPSAEEQAQLARSLALARELGGEVVTTADPDPVEALLHVARQRNVTQVVVGKPQRPWWQEWLRGGSLVNRLVRASGAIDVYVVSGDEMDSARPAPFVRPQPQSSGKQYAVALSVVLGVVALNFLLAPVIGYRSVALVLLLTVSLLALFFGRGPVLAAAGVSALLWDILFIPPQFTFVISETEDALMFGMYFIIAIVTGTLTSRLRAQERATRQREERTEALYALTRDIARALTLDDVLKTAVEQICRLFEAEVAVLVTEANGRLAQHPHAASTYAMDAKELSVAAWAFQNRRLAGRYTDTLPLAEGHYVPLVAPSGPVGVLGVRGPTGLPNTQRWTVEQTDLLGTFAGQVALAIERELLDTAAERATLLDESERLYKTLLNSVSHELRTPIAAILGATEHMRGQITNTGAALWMDEIQAATERLHRLVENLLDMTRLESGLLKLRREWCDVSDLVSVAVNRSRPWLAQHEVIVDVAANLPLVQMDFVLMEQALVNLLHNAATYTPPGTRIRLSARADGGDLLLSVADRGPGLPPDKVEQIFEKFYRAPGAAAGGTGLGLSIVRGLVEAHGGVITAENRAHGGLGLLIRLPLGTPPKVEIGESEA